VIQKTGTGMNLTHGRRGDRCQYRMGMFSLGSSL
jgi:hypothetical protein